MAYWIHESGNRNNSLWSFYQCDYLSDVKLLPTASKEGQPQPNDTVCKNKCAPGSQCLCQEDGSIWLLGKDTDKWIQWKGASTLNLCTSELVQSSEPTTQKVGNSWLQEYM